VPSGVEMKELRTVSEREEVSEHERVENDMSSS
jgi:hypothetical protein